MSRRAERWTPTIVWIALVVSMPVSVVSGEAPPGAKSAGAVFVDADAYRSYDCISEWSQLCGGSPMMSHELEFESSGTIRYRFWPNGDFEFVVSSRSDRRVTGTLAGFPVVLKKERTGWKFVGPQLTGPYPFELIIATAKERGRSPPTATWRFVPREPLRELRARLLEEHAPGGRCPDHKVEFQLPGAGEACLYSHRGWRVMPAGKAVPAGKTKR